MQLLKQSTAATIKLGPFVDPSDGSAETSLTISQADIRLSKNGGDIAQTNNSAGATHDENGWYDVPLDTTDTNTLGRLTLFVNESGALQVFREFLVVTANIYDSFCSTDILQADLVQMGGVAQSATDLKDFADDGYDPSTNKVQGVVLTDTLTGFPVVPATVDDASATTTSFIGSSGLSSTDDFYNGSVLAFTSGALAGLARRINDYVGSTKTLSFTEAFPAAPANGVSFVILGRIN